MRDGSLKEQIEILQQVLSQCGEDGLAQEVRRALDGSEQGLRAFLTSNDLWGGSGSIADQAGIIQDRYARRRIEQALIDLGTKQIEQGVANARTEMWVNTFSKWMQDDI
jgi:hypothetical protein